jgi:hypothetical protein
MPTLQGTGQVQVQVQVRQCEGGDEEPDKEEGRDAGP